MPEVSDLTRHWGYLAIIPVVVLGNAGLPIPEEAVLAVAGYLGVDGSASAADGACCRDPERGRRGQSGTGPGAATGGRSSSAPVTGSV